MKAILILALVLFAETGRACSCTQLPEVKEAYKQADFVALGTIIKRILPKEMDSVDRRYYGFIKIKYQFVVTQLFKGTVSTDTISIITSSGGGDCGYPFDTGKSYIVYGSIKNWGDNEARRLLPANAYTTHICTRTRPENAEELIKLKAVKEEK